MSSFVAAAIGGVLIGLSSALFLLLGGRICGISGILGGTFQRGAGGLWRLFFLGGLFVGGRAMFQFFPESFGSAPALPIWVLVVAGLFVGFGTRLGSGCTSGHGVCGISRFSKRSIVATCTFMAVAAVTVFVTRHVLGGLG